MKSLLVFLLLSTTAMAQKTVICIHGFMRKPSSMKHIAKPLRKVGYSTILWGYPSREKTIEQHAEDLIITLQKIALDRPNEPIHFVTHSMGGIILRAALNHPICPDEAKIGKAVLIAPPNQGSQFGRFLGKSSLFQSWFGDKAGRQLLTQEDFNHLGKFPDSKKVLIISGSLGFNPSISGLNDGKVAISETRLRTLHEHKTVFASHSWIMFYSPTIKEIKKFIRSGS